MDIFGNAPVAAGFKPEYPGELPTLGFEAIHWMTQFLARPTVTRYEPFSPTREQAEFLLKWYQLDPITGQRKYRRGVIQRPKGWGKSPFLSAIAAFEALGNCRFAGWDPWARPGTQSVRSRSLCWLYRKTRPATPSSR